MYSGWGMHMFYEWRAMFGKCHRVSSSELRIQKVPPLVRAGPWGFHMWCTWTPSWRWQSYCIEMGNPLPQGKRRIRTASQPNWNQFQCSLPSLSRSAWSATGKVSAKLCWGLPVRVFAFNVCVCVSSEPKIVIWTRFNLRSSHGGQMVTFFFQPAWISHSTTEGEGWRCPNFFGGFGEVAAAASSKCFLPKQEPAVFRRKNY